MSSFRNKISHRISVNSFLLSRHYFYMYLHASIASGNPVADELVQVQAIVWRGPRVTFPFSFFRRRRHHRWTGKRKFHHQWLLLQRCILHRRQWKLKKEDPLGLNGRQLIKDSFPREREPSFALPGDRPFRDNRSATCTNALLCRTLCSLCHLYCTVHWACLNDAENGSIPRIRVRQIACKRGKRTRKWSSSARRSVAVTCNRSRYIQLSEIWTRGTFAVSRWNYTAFNLMREFFEIFPREHLLSPNVARLLHCCAALCAVVAPRAKTLCSAGNTAAVFVTRHYTVIPRGISGLVNRVNKPPNLLLHSTLLLIDLRFARPRIRSIAFRFRREYHFTRIHACTINCQFAIRRWIAMTATVKVRADSLLSVFFFPFFTREPNHTEGRIARAISRMTMSFATCIRSERCVMYLRSVYRE